MAFLGVGLTICALIARSWMELCIREVVGHLKHGVLVVSAWVLCNNATQAFNSHEAIAYRIKIHATEIIPLLARFEKLILLYN